MIRSWDVISDKDVLNAAFLSKTDIETQNVAGPVNFTGSISILSGLSVGGDASFSGDVQISKELPVFTIKNTSGMDVAIVLDRSSNANWRILSTAGNLKIQSDYTTIKDVYYDILTLYYNTGNASLKGALTAAALSITGDATIAGSTTINGDTIISGAITANKITVLGLAASHPLRTRGIQGITEDGNATDALYLNYGTNHPVYINNGTNIVWHAGNDGSGSGLDADTLDGKHFSDIQNQFVKKVETSSVYTYYNVCSYENGNANQTGIIKIQMPKTWTNTMMMVEIDIYDYTGNTGYSKVLIGGYNYSSGQWYSSTVRILGNLPNNTVRLAHDGTRNCILIGTTSTVWQYPKVVISKFQATHLGKDGWETGWSISLITSESGLTNILAPTANFKLNADTVDDKHYSDITSYVDNAIGTYINQSVKTTASPTFAGLTINGRAKVAAPSEADDIARKDTVDAVQTNLNIHANTSATISVSGHVKHAVLTANLDTTWSGTAPPYTKTVTVSGILSTDTPIIDVVMSGTYSTDEARIEAWGYIYRAVTANGSITFYATEKPTVSLPIQIKVVR